MRMAELIKTIRTQLGLSQEDFAKAIGVAFSTVNRWENGRFEPTPIVRRILKTHCAEHGVDPKLIGLIDTATNEKGGVE